MRKIVSILLLTFLFANGAGFYLYFYFRLKEIRKEMHAEVARTSPELLQKISLPAGEYSLAKRGDDEIEWGGKMYDIASIQFKNGIVEVMALVDEAETNLVALMAKITRAVSSDTKTPPATLMQYLSLTFTAPIPAENLSAPTAHTIVHRTKYSEGDSETHRLITLPPPRG